ncbi:hypothetical protein LCGC14_0306200 [marine sediment metagenome]|uniref:NAD-dependent epimerase/dehydratase domain-containing protein n=1 Tax=marine sediment metagenome TaxID=412755 RepID=A0A0F9WAQ8_9ZZZZ
MNKILVTGGAGFIGSHLVEELVKNPLNEVYVIDDLSTGNWRNIKKVFRSLAFFLPVRVQDVHEDLVNPFFDTIYHLAAKANTRAVGDEEAIDNIDSTRAVVKLLKPNGRIVFSSSCAVYGNQRLVTEKSKFSPISTYGCSKWLNELHIKKHCKNYTIFRFGNVFGERQNGSRKMGLIGVIEYRKKNGKTMTVYNKGQDYRDYIYVKDVVKALVTVKDKDIFQVSNSKAHRTLDLIKLSGVDYKFGKSNPEVGYILLKNSKLRAKGWKPTLSVTEYIKGL